MQKHKFFTSECAEKIKFDIIFDQDPEEGLAFRDNKIFVNTRDPQRY